MAADGKGSAVVGNGYGVRIPRDVAQSYDAQSLVYTKDVFSRGKPPPKVVDLCEHSRALDP